MCDGIKGIKMLRRQVAKAIKFDIDIVEIEFRSGNSHFRDRWTAQEYITDYERRQKGDLCLT